MAEVKQTWTAGDVLTPARLNQGTPATGMTMKNTMDTNYDQWVKLGAVSFTARYQHSSAWVVLTSSDAAGESTHSTMHIKFKQEAALGSAPFVRVAIMDNNSSMQKAQVKAISVVTATVTDVQLWVSVHNQWETVSYTALMVEGSPWTWYENMDFVAVPPGAVATGATVTEFPAKYTHVYADILDIAPSSGQPVLQLYAPGRATPSKVFWNATATDDFGLVHQVNGTNALIIYSDGRLSTGKGNAVVTNDAKAEKITHLGPGGDYFTTGTTTGWVRVGFSTFPVTYATPPFVALTINGNATAIGGKTQVINVTTTGFEIWAEVATINATVYFSYLAVGAV